MSRLNQIINYILRHVRCEYCGTFRGVALHPSMTMYPHEGKWDTFADPNRDVGLCAPCAKLHQDHWDAMWEEYNRGRL